MKFYQNDFPHLEGVVKDGCLFMTLVDIVAGDFKIQVTQDDIREIYNKLNPSGILGHETSRERSGAFVWSHEGVLDGASDILGHPDAKWAYLARIYMPQEISKGYSDYIPDLDYWRKATAMAVQIQTVNGGHFRGLNYDPWRGGTNARYIKSIRYYRRVN